jgi:FkbM family methyltransferase
MNLTAMIPDGTIVGKAVRWPLRLIPPTAQLRVLRGPLRGKKWIAGAGQHGCWLGNYEYEMQSLFTQTINHGDVVYDLGANIGYYSLLAGVLVGTAGQVYSFEPVPRNIKFLRQHLSINRITNCTVVEAAVGRHEGVAQFDFAHNHVSGHLTTDAKGVSVRLVALDDLISVGCLPPPTVIKCDIEGAEYDALIGAAGLLRQYGPTMFISMHSAHLRRCCCAFLTDLGYQLTSVDVFGDDDLVFATR